MGDAAPLEEATGGKPFGECSREELLDACRWFWIARDQWREEAWRCYVESGADPDGADARHLNLGEAIRAVKELRRDYDDACDEAAALEARAERAERAFDARHGGQEDDD
jgi:hypothetical protein